MCRYHQLLSRFLAKGMPRVSRQSCLSANDRVMMRWYRRVCTDLLTFSLQLRKIPEKLQLGDHRWRLCDQSSPQMGSLAPNEVGRIAETPRNGEGRKQGKGGVRWYSCTKPTNVFFYPPSSLIHSFCHLSAYFPYFSSPTLHFFSVFVY